MSQSLSAQDGPARTAGQEHRMSRITQSLARAWRRRCAGRQPRRSAAGRTVSSENCQCRHASHPRWAFVRSAGPNSSGAVAAGRWARPPVPARA